MFFFQASYMVLLIKELKTMHYLKIQLFQINQTLEEEYVGVKNKEVLLDHQLSCMLKIEWDLFQRLCIEKIPSTAFGCEIASLRKSFAIWWSEIKFKKNLRKRHAIIVLIWCTGISNLAALFSAGLTGFKVYMNYSLRRNPARNSSIISA